MLSSFSKQAKDLLTAFHQEIELRSTKKGGGSVGIALLHQQLKNYETIFAALAQQMTELINGLQREANRQFTPVIAKNLSAAYDWCAAESGPGQFNRMKAHMSEHVNTVRDSMFSESCEEVKKLLLAMCKNVQQSMSENTDEVFIRIERDYLEVISGSKLPQGQMMPKSERKMRSEVAQIIADREKITLEGTKEATHGAENASTKKEDRADLEISSVTSGIYLESDATPGDKSSISGSGREGDVLSGGQIAGLLR